MLHRAPTVRWGKSENFLISGVQARAIFAGCCIIVGYSITEPGVSMNANDNKDAAGVNWADYFDALEHEAWLESRKKNFLTYTRQSHAELKWKGNDGPVPEISPTLN